MNCKKITDSRFCDLRFNNYQYLILYFLCFFRIKLKVIDIYIIEKALSLSEHRTCQLQPPPGIGRGCIRVLPLIFPRGTAGFMSFHQKSVPLFSFRGHGYNYTENVAITTSPDGQGQ